MTSIVVLVHLLLVQLLITSAQGDFVQNVTVSTLEGVSFTRYISDMKPHPSDPNSLLLIDYHAILNLNVLTKQTSTVAGVASSRGYVEGVGESARFSSPRSFIIINKKRIIVSDYNNYCLRDVDISTGQTSPLAGMCQSHGFTDGEALQAQFYSPYGLLQYKTGVLVSDYKRMRWLNAGRVSTLVKDFPVSSPRYITERGGVVYISTWSGVVKLNPDTAAVQLIAGHESSTGFSDGPLLSARFDHAYGLVSLSPDVILLADGGNYRLRLLNPQNNTVRSICTGTRASVDGPADRCQLYDPWSITVLNETIYVGDDQRIRTIPLQSIISKGGEPVAIEGCLPSLIEKTLKPGQERTTVETPSVKLILPAGETSLTTNLSNGTECLTTVVVKEGIEVSCPGSITTQLQRGINKTKVSWLMPLVKEGVNQSDVECESCPANSAEFGVGVHTVEYKFTYTPTNFSMSCSFVVVVMGPDNGDQRCSPVLLGLKKGEKTARFVIANNQKNISVRFPVGVYEVETIDQSGESCLIAVKVYDTNPAGWSVLLQVSYPAECEKLNEISYVVIRSLLQQHFADLNKSCQECRLIGDQPYEMNCQAGVLVVQWRTDIQTDTESGDIPDAVETPVLDRLKVIQHSYLNLGGRFLDITVITGTPTVVSPVRNHDGLFLRLRVEASCPLPQMVYDNEDDSCYIP